MIGSRRNLAVQNFKRREEPLEPVKVIALAMPGNAGKRVLNGKKDLLFAEISAECRQIIATALNGHVLPLSDVVYAHMQLCAAWHAAGDLFAHEEIR